MKVRKISREYSTWEDDASHSGCLPILVLGVWLCLWLGHCIAVQSVVQ